MRRTLRIDIHADQATCVEGRESRCRFLHAALTGQAECLLFGVELQITPHLTGRVVRCVECLDAEASTPLA